MRFPEEATGYAIVALAIVFALSLVGAIYMTAGEICAHTAHLCS